MCIIVNVIILPIVNFVNNKKWHINQVIMPQTLRILVQEGLQYIKSPYLYIKDSG